MEDRLVPLEVYAETAEHLQSNAEARGRNMWCTCGKDYDDSELNELETILKRAAEEIREVLVCKVSELPEDISDEMLDAYGLLAYK